MATTWATGERVVPPGTAEDDIVPSRPDAAMVKAIAHAIASVQARYPTASSELGRDGVDDAFDQLRTARITLYLPILIERNAGRAVADAIRWEARDR